MIENLIEQLNKQIEKITELKGLNHLEKGFKEWKLEIESILKKCPYITANPSIPDLIDRFNGLSFWDLRMRMPDEPYPDREDLETYAKSLEDAEIILKQIIKELQDSNFYPKPREEKPRMGF